MSRRPLTPRERSEQLSLALGYEQPTGSRPRGRAREVDVGEIGSVVPAGVVHAVRSVFAFAEIADEEIAAAFGGDKRSQPAGIFSAMRPPPILCFKESLYRAHVRELCERWRGPRSIELLTRAEIVGLLSEASLRHPLSHRDTEVMETLFRELFPSEAEAVLGPAHPAREGEAAEVAESIREWRSRRSPVPRAEAA